MKGHAPKILKMNKERGVFQGCGLSVSPLLRPGTKRWKRLVREEVDGHHAPRAGGRRVFGSNGLVLAFADDTQAKGTSVWLETFGKTRKVELDKIGREVFTAKSRVFNYHGLTRPKTQPQLRLRPHSQQR